jgi:beta-lactamase class D
MMAVETTATYTIRAKTGYVFSTKPAVGWWIGWVERGPDTYFFAMNMDLNRPEQAKARIAITKKVLKELGAI